MPFKEGKTKTGGRKKGVPNKINTSLKVRLSNIGEALAKEIEANIDKLDLADKVIFFTKILPYLEPKKSERMTKIDFSTLTEDECQIIIDEITEKLKAA